MFDHIKEDCPWGDENTTITYYKACEPLEIQGTTYLEDDTESDCAIIIGNNVYVGNADTDIIFEAPYIEINGNFIVSNGATIELINP